MEQTSVETWLRRGRQRFHFSFQQTSWALSHPSAVCHPACWGSVIGGASAVWVGLTDCPSFSKLSRKYLTDSPWEKERKKWRLWLFLSLNSFNVLFHMTLTHFLISMAVSYINVTFSCDTSPLITTGDSTCVELWYSKYCTCSWTSVCHNRKRNVCRMLQSLSKINFLSHQPSWLIDEKIQAKHVFYQSKYICILGMNWVF